MDMPKEKIKITRRGEDGYRLISARIKEETLKKIDELAKETNRSRNDIINTLLDSSVDNVEIE